MGVCLERLLWYEREGEKFLDHIVEGYKSWSLHCDPETIQCVSIGNIHHLPD